MHLQMHLAPPLAYILYTARPLSSLLLYQWPRSPHTEHGCFCFSIAMSRLLSCTLLIGGGAVDDGGDLALAVEVVRAVPEVVALADYVHPRPRVTASASST